MTGTVLRRLAIATAGVFVAFATGPAFAADLGGKVPMAEPGFVDFPGQDWAGVYFGGHLGGMIDGDEDIAGGLQLGHNWQRGNVVFGGEGDVSFADETFGTVRARLGLASPSWLLYGTVGVAIDDSDAGLTAGGGLEYKIARHTSIGVEALHYDLDDDFTIVRGRLTWHFGGS